MVKHEGFFGSTTYQVIVFLVLLATLSFSIMAFYNSKQLKEFIIPKTLDISDFKSKLNAHTEMKELASTEPLNIIQITNANLQNLQSQIRDLDSSFIGNFLVQYKEAIVVYDYLNDTIKGLINIPPALPSDFSEKLLMHTELKNYKTQQPTRIAAIDETSLAQLKEQQPDIFKNAKIGDYIVAYQDRVFVFDYKKDKIVANYKLPNQ